MHRSLGALFGLSGLFFGSACSSDRHRASADAAVTDAGSSSVRVVGGTRLSFAAADGTVVLESAEGNLIANGVPYSSFGFSTGAEPELALRTFGTAATVAADGGVTDAGASPNARHVATSLKSMTKTSSGFIAVLNTDDPAGRTLTLTVTEADTVRVDVTASDPDGVTAVFASFASADDEAFHGFGGRRESTDLRGKDFSNWVFDYRFPDESTSYYYPQPMFLSSKGYAAWLDTTRIAHFRLGEDANAWRASVAGSALSLVVVPKSGVDALAAVTSTTGRHRVPPSWSMGPTLSRTIQIAADKPDIYQAKVQADVTHVLNDGLGVEAYAYEGWARLPTAFVQSTNATLSAAGVHPVLYMRCYVADDAAGTEPLGRLAEATKAGYVAKKADGTPYFFKSPFDNSDAALIDFTNPDAQAWWKGLVKQMLDLGADGFMNDFGEQVLPDMVFSDGSTGVTMHNRYPVLQHATTRAAVDEYMAAHPDRQIFFFVRAGYAGSPGSVASENAQFPGDETCDWNPATGLPSIVPDMLNRATFGGYGFDTDIGGYADFSPAGIAGPDQELYTRWTEAAVFTPFFRVHNSGLTGVKMPWSFDATTEATWKEMAALHTKARPLILELWQAATTTAAPPIRPLWFGGSPKNAHDDDEWMVGEDLLVAPVLAKGATTREVYFPTGCWQLHGTEPGVSGPVTQAVDAPIGVLPWFTRCGTSPLE
jgi:alpha-glucosidase